jgi:hypothetical protein
MPDTYLKLNDALPEHRKIVDAGGDAAWLHVCALAYASRNLTDGYVPSGVVPRLSDRKQPAKLAARLVEVGLWHAAGHTCPRCPQPGPSQYLIHDYLVHQRSAAKVEEIKAKRAVAGRSGGTRKAANAKTRVTPKTKQTPSNLLDGWQESVEANATPDTEVVLRTTRTDKTLPPTAGAEAPRNANVVPIAEGSSVTQRSKRLTDSYYAVEPMCNWNGVNQIVIKAIKAGKWTDQEIHNALLRLAEGNRGVSVETLRRELAPPMPSTHRQVANGSGSHTPERGSYPVDDPNSIFEE